MNVLMGRAIYFYGGSSNCSGRLPESKRHPFTSTGHPRSPSCNKGIAWCVCFPGVKTGQKGTFLPSEIEQLGPVGTINLKKN